MHSKNLINEKKNTHLTEIGVHLEIEKKYLLIKSEVDFVEKKCQEILLSQISNQYEKNQNFDKDNMFDKEDARLRLRTKISDLNNQNKSFEFLFFMQDYKIPLYLYIKPYFQVLLLFLKVDCI